MRLPNFLSTLDFLTSLIVASSVSITVAAVLLLIWWRDRSFAASLWWGVGFAATGLGLTLVAGRGHVPDVLSIEIANTAVLSSVGSLVAGVAVFHDRPVRPWVLVPALVWVAGVSVPQIRESLALRICLYDTATAIGFGMLFVLMWPGWRDTSAARRPLAFIFLFQAAFNVTSAAIVYRFPPSDLRSYSQGSLILLVALLGLILVVIYGGKLIMERSEAKLRVLAETDPLTHVLNRRGLIGRFDNMVAAHRGTERSLALLIFDLDHFKRINDRFGHLAGDAALASFARLAAACLRQGDSFGRLGGEEFAAVLAVSHADEAATIAEHVRTAVAARPIIFDEVRIEVTVSIGIAAMPASRADFNALMSAADRALYAAKISGRNQTRADETATSRLVVTPLRRKSLSPV
jgi:diguanylate cyclase (GGDEF)-like protein